MNAEEKLTLYIAKEIINPGQSRRAIESTLNWASIDWERFKNLINYHDLATFAYENFKDNHSLLPEDINSFLRYKSYACIINTEYLWKNFLEILNVVVSKGIDLVPIKGIALVKDIYRNKGLRFMDDVDILVKKQDVTAVEEIISALGYRKELKGLREEYWRKNNLNISYKKNVAYGSVLVELHWSLDIKRDNTDVLPNVWNRLREIIIDGHQIKLLSAEDTFFSLALHQRRFCKTLCLKNVIDFGLLYKKYNDSFDWDYVLREAYRYNMRSAVFYLLSLADIFLDVNIPDYIWRGLKINFSKRKLIRYFIEKNTFAYKNTYIAKRLYLKSHFLLYDNLRKPIAYILNIPKEQFAKFYQLNPYDRRTDFIYRNRLIYIPLRTLFNTHTNGR
jgi:hypothetical protein